MRIDPTRLVLSSLLLASAATAPAQGLPSGGIGSLLGGALPSVGRTGAGNAAGVLGYCVKNKLVGDGQASAQSVIGKLTGQKGVADSPEYTAGQSGQLQTGTGMLSLNNLKGKVKTKVCDMVLSRAKSFL